MPRFDPDAYPERLAFEAHARRLRSDEIARIARAALRRLAAAIDYVSPLASTPISRDTRMGTSGR